MKKECDEGAGMKCYHGTIKVQQQEASSLKHQAGLCVFNVHQNAINIFFLESIA